MQKNVAVMRLFEGTPFDRPPRCERCEQLESQCVCPPEPEPRTPPGNQTARLSLEKRKRGKVVTVVSGLLDEGTALRDTLTRLQARCGAGGTVRDGVLELQGDQIEKVRSELIEIGFRVKG